MLVISNNNSFRVLFDNIRVNAPIPLIRPLASAFGLKFFLVDCFSGVLFVSLLMKYIYSNTQRYFLTNELEYLCSYCSP